MHYQKQRSRYVTVPYIVQVIWFIRICRETGDPLQLFWALVNHRLSLDDGYPDRSAKETKAEKISWPRRATAVGTILLSLVQTYVHPSVPLKIGTPGLHVLSVRRISLRGLPIGFA